MALDRLILSLKHLAGKHPQKSHAGSRGSGISVTIEGYDSEFPEQDGDPWELADKAGIYVSSDKIPSSVAMDDEGEMLGASFVSEDYSSGEYSMDIVVAKAAQGKGVGTKLLDDVMTSYSNFSYEVEDMGTEATFRVDAVNPQMASMLAKRGFEETGVTPSGVEMYYRES